MGGGGGGNGGGFKWRRYRDRGLERDRKIRRRRGLIKRGKDRGREGQSKGIEAERGRAKG